MRIVIILVSDPNRTVNTLEQTANALEQLCCDYRSEIEIQKFYSSSNQDEIEQVLRKATNQGSLVFTLGGTGIGPTDFTPEATRSVCQQEIPGIGELIRVEGAKFTDKSWIGRGTAGIFDATLIVNLPGRTKALKECFEICADLVFHIVRQLEKMQ
jgi:molybdopterin adenylyltransferase